MNKHKIYKPLPHRSILVKTNSQSPIGDGLLPNIMGRTNIDIETESDWDL
jgi:hypothetical protein